MKRTDCRMCACADVPDKPIVIVKGNTTIYRPAGNVNSACSHIVKKDTPGDGLTFSSFMEVADA